MQRKAVFFIPIFSLLFIAFFYPLPYGFYTLNRIIVSFFSVIGAILIWDNKRFLSYTFIFAAVLFNPVIPIHLTRNIWQIIDIVAAVPFLLLIFPGSMVSRKNPYD